MTKRTTQTGSEDLALAFLEFFYPIHYQLGKAIEDTMRSGQLTRKQAAILWLIRSEGKGGREMRRKDIQQLITTWFEISNPSLSRELRMLAKPPLGLVRLSEDPNSAREQTVALTVKGERFLATMVEKACQLLSPLIATVPEDSVKMVLTVFREYLPGGIQLLPSTARAGFQDGEGIKRKPGKRQAR